MLHQIDKRNGTNAYQQAIQLGSLITRFNTGTEGAVDEYFDYVDTYFNWESTTVDMRTVFLNMVECAYIACYIAAMTELNMEMAGYQEQINAENLANADGERYEDLLWADTIFLTTPCEQGTNVYKTLVGGYGADANTTD